MVGTYFLAREFAEHLKLKEKEKRLLCVAAFVHDAGHGPLGHALEQMAEYMSGNGGMRLSKLDKVVLDNMLGDPNNHLTMALRSVFDDNDFSLLRKILIPYYEADKTALETVRPGLSFVLDLLSADVDVDRIDYLTRDTLHGEPPFADDCPFPDLKSIRQLIEKSTLQEYRGTGKMSLAFRDDARLTLLEVLNYRKMMYDNVYLSPEKIVIDTMVCHALFYCLEENGLEMKRGVLSEITKFTDADLMDFMRKIGPPWTQKLLDRIEKGPLYITAVKHPFPFDDPRYELFNKKLAEMSSNLFGFYVRVRMENEFAKKIPANTLSASPADLPPVIFSFPPSYTPVGHEETEVGYLEHTRSTLILTGDGNLEELGKLEVAKYAKTSPVYAFHVLVPPELESHVTDIRKVANEELGL